MDRICNLTKISFAIHRSQIFVCDRAYRYFCRLVWTGNVAAGIYLSRVLSATHCAEDWRVCCEMIKIHETWHSNDDLRTDFIHTITIYHPIDCTHHDNVCIFLTRMMFSTILQDKKHFQTHFLFFIRIFEIIVDRSRRLFFKRRAVGVQKNTPTRKWRLIWW